MGRLRAIAAWAAAGAALAGPGAARGDGYFLQLEEQFRASETETRSQGEAPTSSDDLGFTHRYRLNLDKTLFPYLTFAAAGLLDWTETQSDSEGIHTDSESRRWNVNARLAFGPPVLSGAASYDRTTTDANQRVRGQPRFDAPTLIREQVAATGAWRPLGGPAIDALASLSDDRDERRAVVDRRTTQLGLGAVYREIENWDLRANVRYSGLEDQISGVDTTELSESAQVGWGDRFLDRRLTTSATYSVGHRNSRVEAARPDAIVTTLQVPFEALSLIEPAVADPTRVTLLVNPALADTNVVASAGIDIGYGVRPADTRLRDLGVRFVDPATAVNRIYVYVDRAVPVTISPLFTWRAFSSDDNVTWSELPGVGPVSFGLLDNRFEITIPRTAARYVKVVVAPLPTGATTDPTLATILVTEIQALLAEPAAARVGTSSETTGSFTAAARMLLDERWNLSADSAFFVAHGGQENWSFANGLSAGRRLGAWSSWSARVDRTDSGDETGHTAVSRLSAAVSADPLATLGASLTGNASLTQDPDGTGWSTSASALAHADLYTGVALSGNATAGVGQPPDGIESRFYNAAISASVIPHPTTSLNGSYSVDASEVEGDGGRTVWDRRSRIEGSLSFSPFPALGVSGSVSRTFDENAVTQSTVSVGFSPFQGGALAVRFGFTDHYDSSSDQRTRNWGPALRWTIRPGWYVDSNYTLETVRSPALDTDGQSFLATLVGTLR